jgi:hypothetical protein
VIILADDQVTELPIDMVHAGRGADHQIRVAQIGEIGHADEMAHVDRFLDQFFDVHVCVRTGRCQRP